MKKNPNFLEKHLLLLHHRQDAEDVTQEVFLRIFRSLKRWDSKRPIKPWIMGITVNRWPHGYAYSIDTESGDVAWSPELWQHERQPWVDARQRVGNIAFAGTDAAANAMTESAIEEAHRAVHSLVTETAG